MTQDIHNLQIGDLIRIEVDGHSCPFRVMSKNYPHNSGRGILLMSAQVLTYLRLGHDAAIPYTDSSIRSWLNETFYNSIDSAIQPYIQEVPVPSLHIDHHQADGSDVREYTPDNMEDKVFVPSMTEIFGVYEDEAYEQGTKLDIDASNWALLNGERNYYITRNSGWTDLRGEREGSFYHLDMINCRTAEAHTVSMESSNEFKIGIAPMFCLSGTLKVSAAKRRCTYADLIGRTLSWDAYDIVFNTPPTAPPKINVPNTVTGGEALEISWDASTDAQGNLAGYKLERATSDTDPVYREIYAGMELAFTDTIRTAWNHVQYRVRSYDTDGEHSAYTTGPLREVDNISPPEINSSASGDQGEKDQEFSISYSLKGMEREVLTVVETLDGVDKRSYLVTLNSAGTANNSFDVTDDYFKKLFNGRHTMEITVTNSSGKTAALALSFTKAVSTCVITLETPMRSDTVITKLVLSVLRKLPGDANFKVRATNNANDGANTVWEDITNAVLTKQPHMFTNRTVAQGHAFNFEVTASRGPDNMGGYIRSIGGAFV